MVAQRAIRAFRVRLRARLRDREQSKRAGLAIGFGAQSLAKDYFTGFFVLIENQIRLGDVVQLDSHSGLVEEMTLHYVRLRHHDGNAHLVPNGEIKTVVKMAREHAQVVVDVGATARTSTK